MSFHQIASFCFLVLAIFVANTTVSYSDENQRPSANNKMKHTKKSAEERENSIINRILKNEVFTSQERESKNRIEDINSYELVINQIKALSELNRDGYLTNEEFEAKKAILLDRIQ
mgnify:FL=1